jgi:hypothetical protein
LCPSDGAAFADGSEVPAAGFSGAAGAVVFGVFDWAGAGVWAAAGAVAATAATRVRQKARFIGGEPANLEGEIRIGGNASGVNVRAATHSCDAIAPKA